MSNGELEALIRRIDGVLLCEITDTEVVILLAEGADGVAVASLVSHLVSEASPGRVVRLMGIAPSKAPARRPWALAGWVTAGTLAVTTVALLVALMNDNDDLTSPVAPSRASSTSIQRTTSTTGASTTATTAPPTAATPTTTAPPTTASTSPPLVYAIERHECRQDGRILTLRGAIVNKSRSRHSYRIIARFLNGADRLVASGMTDVGGVAPGERRTWIVQVGYEGDLPAEGGSCRVSARVLS